MGKRKRGKRLFPRRYASDTIKTDRFDPNRAAALNAMRSKATVGGGPNTEHKLGNTFMQAIPQTGKLRPLDWDSGVPVPVPSARAEVVDRQHQIWFKEAQSLHTMFKLWKGDRHQGLTKFHFVTLEDMPEYREIMFFSGNSYIIVLEFDNTRMISKTYEGRDALMSARKRGLSWAIEEKIQE